MQNYMLQEYMLQLHVETTRYTYTLKLHVTTTC